MPSKSDHDWFARRPLSIPAARLSPKDIEIARRLMKATTANPKKYGSMRTPLKAFLDRARAARPDLFQGKPRMRVRRPGASPIGAEAMGDPSKTLKRPRTQPTTKVWYREILVGKRN
jgi:hypothetical protein